MRKYGLKAVAGVLLIALLFALSNPLRRSQESIKKSILKMTPIGSSMEDVLIVIESKKKWELEYVSDLHGYREPYAADPDIGEKSIRVFWGDYTFFLKTSVVVFWGFDADSKLIDVYVWKDKDVP